MTFAFVQELVIKALNTVRLIPKATETIQITEFANAIRREHSQRAFIETLHLIADLLKISFTILTAYTLTWVVKTGFAGRITRYAIIFIGGLDSSLRTFLMALRLVQYVSCRTFLAD